MADVHVSPRYSKIRVLVSTIVSFEHAGWLWVYLELHCYSQRLAPGWLPGTAPDSDFATQPSPDKEHWREGWSRRYRLDQPAPEPACGHRTKPRKARGRSSFPSIQPGAYPFRV